MAKKPAFKKPDANHSVNIASNAIASVLRDAGITDDTAHQEARDLVIRLLDEKNRVKDPEELAYEWLETNVKNSADPRMCVIGIIEHTPALFESGRYDLPFAMFSFVRFRAALRRSKFSHEECEMFLDMLDMFQYTASMYVNTKPNDVVRINPLSERDISTTLLNTDEYAPDVEIPKHIRKQFSDMMVTHLRRNFVNTLVMYAPEYIADAKKRKWVETTYKIKFEHSDMDDAREALEDPNNTKNAMLAAARQLPALTAKKP